MMLNWLHPLGNGHAATLVLPSRKAEPAEQKRRNAPSSKVPKVVTNNTNKAYNTKDQTYQVINP